MTSISFPCSREPVDELIDERGEITQKKSQKSHTPNIKDIKTAAAVADFLGIRVPKKSLSHQVGAAINEVFETFKQEIEALKRQIETLKLANTLVSDQWQQSVKKAEQLERELYDLRLSTGQLQKAPTTKGRSKVALRTLPEVPVAVAGRGL